MKKLTIAIIALALSGCVIQKQQMPFQYYQEISSRDASVDQCVSLGFMSYQTAAAAKNYNLQDLSRWRYGASFYQSAYDESTKRLADKPLHKRDCERLNVAVMQRELADQKSYQQQQLAAQQQQAMSQSMMAIQNATPRTTYCDKRGAAAGWHLSTRSVRQGGNGALAAGISVARQRSHQVQIRRYNGSENHEVPPSPDRSREKNSVPGAAVPQ